MNKKMYLIPCYFLAGVIIFLGTMHVFFPKMVTNFIMGFFDGIKAPFIIIFNIFCGDFHFYKNSDNSNIYNIGFILGIVTWKSPKQIIKKNESD